MNRLPLVLSRGLLGVALGLMLVGTATPIAASAKNCVTVTVLDPLELPDGSIHPAGSLTLCSVRSLSPVAQMHLVSVDGIPVGYLLSRTGVSEGPGPLEPMVTFHRDRKGKLHLVGYAWPAGKRSRTYLLQDPRPSRGPIASPATASVDAGVGRESGGSPAFLAAIAP